jgi:hypothetical protein
MARADRAVARPARPALSLELGKPWVDQRPAIAAAVLAEAGWSEHPTAKTKAPGLLPDPPHVCADGWNWRGDAFGPPTYRPSVRCDRSRIDGVPGPTKCRTERPEQLRPQKAYAYSAALDISPVRCIRVEAFVPRRDDLSTAELDLPDRELAERPGGRVSLDHLRSGGRNDHDRGFSRRGRQLARLTPLDLQDVLHAVFEPVRRALRRFVREPVACPHNADRMRNRRTLGWRGDEHGPAIDDLQVIAHHSAR